MEEPDASSCHGKNWIYRIDVFAAVLDYPSLN
jgi:hypothetical protein